MAKKASAKAGKKKGAAAKGRKQAGGQLLKQLETLEQQKAKLLQGAAAKKEAELKKARRELDEALDRVRTLERELRGLTGKSVRGRGRPKGSTDRASGRGRKPRVNIDVKRQHVANALKKYPRGVQLRALRADLEKATQDGTPVFAPPDFNSSETFGKRLLPAGWKMEGERREARIVKK